MDLLLLFCVILTLITLYFYRHHLPICLFLLYSFLAFPCHLFLLKYGFTDTQQKVMLDNASLFAGIFIYLISLILVLIGSSTSSLLISKLNIPFPTKPAFDKKFFIKQDCLKSSYILSLPPPPSLINKAARILLTLILFALFFYCFIYFKTNSLIPYVDNEQNLARFGNGPLFILQHLFVYGLIACIPILFSGKLISLDNKKIFLSIYICGIILACFFCVVFHTRRLIVMPLLGIVLMFLIKKKWLQKTIFILLFVIIIGAPVFQFVRYIYVETHQHKYSEQIEICNVTFSSPFSSENYKIREVASSLLSKKENYPYYYFLQVISSSFGMMDSLSTYINKSSSFELLLGHDYGKAMAYNVFLSLIPRFLWTTKPLLYGNIKIQSVLYPDMYKDTFITMSLPPSYIVEYSYSFGLFSFFILCFLTGSFLSYINYGLNSKNNFYFCISLFSTLNIFELVRSGTAFFCALLIFSVICFVIYGATNNQYFSSRDKNVYNK